MQSSGSYFAEFFKIVGDAATGAAEGKAGPDDAGQMDFPDDFIKALGEQVGNGLEPPHLIFFQGLGVEGLGARGDLSPENHSSGQIQIDVAHSLGEFLSVLGLAYGLDGGAYHFYAELFEHTVFSHSHSGIQSGLATECGQQGVGAFALDDFGDAFRGDRLDISAVGKLGVGHYGGGIGVYKNDLVALLSQGLAGLSAGIVELTALTNNNRA